MDPAFIDTLCRLGAAMVLGGLIGLEREIHGQPAGLRTHAILTIGAALAALLSIHFAIDHRGTNPNADPGRLAAQVISGIGFLGAGAILRLGVTIKGLTTATSLWTSAIIGLACGAAAYPEAAAATTFVIVSLTALDHFEKRIVRGKVTRVLRVHADDRPGLVGDLEEALADEGVRVVSVQVSKEFESNQVDLKIIVKAPPGASMDRLIAALGRTAATARFEVE